MNTQGIAIKIADEGSEFAQIAKLNYATFVEEIPQHKSNPDRALVDKFHKENIYFIAKVGADIVGMLALRNQRPFSLDSKLPNLNDFVESNESLCEIRLLAIQPSHRHSRVLRGLFRALFAHCVAKDFDRALISGRMENIPLYTKLGFQAFSEPVGNEGARYQPMFMTRETVNRNLRAIPVSEAMDQTPMKLSHCFLPGPVALHASVEATLHRPSYSHRSQRYAQLLADTKDRLLRLTHAKATELFLGTGTLANDVVAAHIAQLGTNGLILSNGEFGNRLVNHVHGFKVPHAIHEQAWGEAFDLQAVRVRLQQDPSIRWLWCVHCETSTGRINPIEAIQALCDANGVSMHIDGISSLGVVPCDWSRARMATTVSGKGVGALTGISIVFYDPVQMDMAPALVAPPVPGYLNLRNYAAAGGQPYSGSSLWLEALAAALRLPQAPRDSRRLAHGKRLVQLLHQLNLPLVVDGEARSPGVFTVQLPNNASSRELGDSLLSAGIECNYASSYLLKRNWLQICFMGEISDDGLENLGNHLARYFK